MSIYVPIKVYTDDAGNKWLLHQPGADELSHVIWHWGEKDHFTNTGIHFES